MRQLSVFEVVKKDDAKEEGCFSFLFSRLLGSGVFDFYMGSSGRLLMVVLLRELRV